jgi:hypothetical protein
MVETEKICGNVNCKKIGKHLCAGCVEEIYCSRECQKEHWSAHKLACKTAVKPEAAAFLKSFDDLSVKQLKNIMKAKSASFDKKKKDKVLANLERIVEKPSLVKLVQEHVTLDEIESLLTASTPASDATTSSSSSINAKKKATPASTNGQVMPTPAQLRQNAKMMREHPNLVRQQNAAFKNMTDAQIRSYADQMEIVSSLDFYVLAFCRDISVFSIALTLIQLHLTHFLCLFLGRSGPQYDEGGGAHVQTVRGGKKRPPDHSGSFCVMFLCVFYLFFNFLQAFYDSICVLFKF